MGITGTEAQVEARRRRGVALLAKGFSCNAVAARVGVSPGTVRRWRRERQLARTPQRRQRGVKPRLTAKALDRLAQTVRRGAYAQGYAEDYWTLDRIARLIWDLFGVRYHPSGVWRLLRRLGWSNQKPQRQALQRDEGALAHWKRYVWPHIKKVS
jgi:transposase